MEEKQLEKRLTWLDEQNRVASEKIKDLEASLIEAQASISAQSKQIEDLSDEISRLAGLTTRIHSMDETLQKHRKEVSRQLEQAEKRRTDKEANLDALRKSDQKALSVRLDGLQKELEITEKIDQDLILRREEEIRLAKEITQLLKRIDKLEDKTSSMSDQQRTITREQDKAMKANQKAKTDLNGLRKSTEQAQGKLDALLDSNRSLDTRITELISAESERADGQARWIERQELTLVEFENEWKKWGRRFDSIENQADEFDDRLAAYEEMHRALKQMRTELGELMDRLERRITEVSEMQRLGDNRMKHEWSSFQAEDIKRWNTYKLTVDEQWREHNRLHEKLKTEGDRMAIDLASASSHLDHLLESDRMRLGELLSMLREWISEATDGKE